MKRIFMIMMLMMLTVLIAGIAVGDPMVYVKTDKTMYLMDPYYWVYEASKYQWWNTPSEIWPTTGYSRDVNFTVKTYDATGKVKDLGAMNYQVLGTKIPKSGLIAATADPGVYSGTFQLWDDDLGGKDFSGQQPKQLTLQVLDSANKVLIEKAVYVGRWGCDRCHIGYDDYSEKDNPEKTVSKKLYPWSGNLDGGPHGPHHWANILGRNGTAEGFDITYLTDSTKTHIPVDYLTSPAGHEKTIRKNAGDAACSPCHRGEGQLRHDYNVGQFPWSAHAEGEAVECTFCHGIEGGYVPAIGTWADNAGYISEGHGHKNVPALEPATLADPWLARQNCANIGCHGHINETNDRRIDKAKPDCRSCHGIHNLNPH
jgi:hypothetical protein